MSPKIVDRYNQNSKVDKGLQERKVSQRIIHTIKNSDSSPFRVAGTDKESELTLKPLL